MISNYFKIAFRNLLRHRLFSFINIAGLAVGLTCCLLLALYVQHELSYDTFYVNKDRIARVVMEFKVQDTEEKIAVTGTKVFPAFKRDFPEVENGVRFYDIQAIVQYSSQSQEEKGFVYADSTIFDVFSFPLLHGNAKTALEKPNTVVLTESTARRYFGKESPLGKVLRVNNEKDFEITGVVADCPENSQIKFDFLASFSSIGGYSNMERWWGANYITYLLLHSPEAIQTLQAKIPDYMDAQKQENGLKGNDYMNFWLEPLTKVHLYSDVAGNFEPNGDIRYVYIFSAIALLILAIACGNYMNMTTARASERAREVGIRKVVGAKRKQLFWQFIGESMIITGVALLLSILFTTLLLPTFNELAGRNITFKYQENPTLLFGLLSLGLLVSLLAGSYPALMLSSFQPVKTLKGYFKTSVSGIVLRRVLIVFQFVISIALIVCTIVIHRQLHFIQNKKLGYEKAHRIVLPADGPINQKISTFKSEFKTNPDVKNVSFIYRTLTSIPSKYGLTVDSRDYILTANGVDKDFVATQGVKIIAGSDFSEADVKEMAAGTRNFLILNKQAVRDLGWSPEEALEKTIHFEGKPSQIKAVVEDFHFASLHDPIIPIVLFLQEQGREMLVQLSGENLPQTLAFLEEKWKTLAPHRPFTYHFLDEEFAKMYKAETRTGLILSIFSGLAIWLACLGLFGLAIFMAAQRTKEIGIRKVLGASITSIITLLSKDFLKLVLFSTLVAFPLAWWAMRNWLEDFTYRIDIQWWMFALAGAVALTIALLTVSFQAIRAAVVNPVESLKNE